MFTISKKKKLENSILMMKNIHIPKKTPFKPYLTPTIKINMKWLINQNVRVNL